MSESDASWQVACTVDELTEGEPTVVDVDGTDVALFVVDGEYYALNNVCPHQGGPLGDGKVEDDCVYCPWHGWQFDVATGEHVQGEDTVGTYDVVVEDDGVFVRV